LWVATSCSHDSYLKVTLIAADSAFEHLTRVVVNVHDESNGSSAWLQYVPTNEIRFDTFMSKTLSIAFTPNRAGAISLDVGVFDNTGACLGRGQTTSVLKKGDVSSATVMLAHTSICPLAPDAGVADTGGDVVTFSGCDPARPADSCANNQTCFVDCRANRGICLLAGAKGPGELCSTNADCTPGTQCFDYSGLPGCGVGTKVCQKFCNNDAQCLSAAGGTGGAAGSPASDGTGGAGGGVGGVGATGGATGGGGSASPGVSTCRNPVVCSGNVTTSYRTCSFACDPRADGTSGCPTGLLCFLYTDSTIGQDSPDCGCKEPTRTGTDGAPCDSSAACAPGFICNKMGGTQACRKLCKMVAASDCAAPKICSALANNTVFGVCIGS
jgi:hypothetical protein